LEEIDHLGIDRVILVYLKEGVDRFTWLRAAINGELVNSVINFGIP
jgi:hypothetical protein